MKTSILFLAVLTSSLFLNSTCKKEVSNECSSCEQPRYVQSFSSTLGILKKVTDGEPYFDGRKFYLLVDAKSQLQNLFKQNLNQYERIFPCSRGVQFLDSDTGKIFTISGTLYKCTTADHGLLSNNLFTFNIYAP